MRHESGTTIITETMTDVQFAVRRTGKVDWRSRPAAALATRRDPRAAAVDRRIKRGLLLDGLGA
jgi:hypothetical protein